MAEQDDADIARVLRAAKGRSGPSEEMTRAVYEAVHSEWRTMAAARQKQRTRRAWLAAAAASVVLAVSALFLSRTLTSSSPGGLVANVSRSAGVIQVKDADSSNWRYLGETRALFVGEQIHTGADGRMAITTPDGVSIRLDRYTNVALVTANRIDLNEGAVYIDSGSSAGARGKLEVGTPTGVVRHVGTQYEARVMHTRGTRISVREGRVEVERAAGTRTFGAGTQVLVAPRGFQEPTSIEPHSEEWNWVLSTAPEFDIGGRRVDEFLSWAGRETGLKVVFASPETEAEAKRAVLSGSVSGLGLSPQEALAAVLPTVNLRSTQRDGQLVIEPVPTP
jgi:hypothetical protein